MPFTSISKKIVCVDLLPLFPLPASPVSLAVPMSVSYYEVFAIRCLSVFITNFVCYSNLVLLFESNVKFNM